MKFKNKFGYVQIDILFAIMIFFLFFFFVLFEYQSTRDSVLFQKESMNLKISANQICSLLISNQGIPANWNSNINSLEIIGLLNSSNQIDEVKLTSFNDSSNYINIVSSLGIESILYVEVLDESSKTTISKTGVLGSPSIIEEKASCFSSYNNELVRIEVNLWN